MEEKQKNMKTKWLAEGLELLGEKGAQGLTIDSILKRLKVTKGSFYHHFKNRQDFTRALLEYWQQEFTQEVIQHSKSGINISDKLNRLLAVSTAKVNVPLEIAIRAWAMNDTLVKAYQENVDQQRRDYCISLCEELAPNNETGKIWGKILFAIYVGSQQMLPRLNDVEVANIFEATQVLFETATISKIN
ncbi:MAG: TetR/AcrR family transcriptional regulator [SAR324 cluster bacterium]|nr:TetR/AcrR family transcriptional regulator [SAR324 cluster bacterium]